MNFLDEDLDRDIPNFITEDYTSSDCEHDLEEINRFYMEEGSKPMSSFNRFASRDRRNKNILNPESIQIMNTGGQMSTRPVSRMDSRGSALLHSQPYSDVNNFTHFQQQPLSFQEAWDEDIQDNSKFQNSREHDYLHYTSEIKDDGPSFCNPVVITDTRGLRQVEEVSKEFSAAFSFRYFNRMQSECFSSIYQSDTNTCVAAPTSSGKTVLFKLAMIRVWENSSTGKCIYIAPTKSLCQQKVREFSNSFSSCRKRVIVKEVTGDTQEATIVDMINADIIVTTPEKFDSVTRGWSISRNNENFVRSIRLVCIDEVHLLNDSRGHSLEAIVSRLKSIASINSQDMRVVAASATIPNLDDIGDWLGCPPSHRYSFGEGYRPVPLETHVLGYPQPDNQNVYIFQRNLSYALLDIILQYSEGKPTLIFCATRKETSNTVDAILKEAESRGISFVSDRMTRSILNTASCRISNSTLKKQISIGCAHHSAALSASDRALVEDLYLQGHLKILCSTTTLALGVNLPARLVIVKGTQSYIQGSGYREYDILTILQMLGRAGRPQFDSMGCAVIMTTMEQRDVYTSLVRNQLEIESSFQNHIVSHLNSEIHCRSVCNPTQALNWIKSTFLYIRLLKNPMMYGLRNDEDVEEYLSNTITTHLNDLQRFELIYSENNILRSTELGLAMSKYYISFETMKQLTRMDYNPNLEDVFFTLCHSQEFEEFPFRRGEKKILNEINKHKCAVFKCKGKINLVYQKIALLIQAAFGEYKFENDKEISNQIPMIMKIAPRIARCMKSVAQYKSNYNYLLQCTILEKCLKQKIWPTSEYLTKQLPGIGKVYSQKLSKAGIHTLGDVLRFSALQLDKIIGRQRIGSEILRKARSIPMFNIEYTLDDKDGEIILTIKFVRLNEDNTSYNGSSFDNHYIYMIGNMSGNLLQFKRIDGRKVKNSTKITLHLDKLDNQNHKINISIQSEMYVGVDSTQCIKIPNIHAPSKPQTPKSRRKAENSLSPLQVVIEKAKSIRKRKSDLQQDETPPMKKVRRQYEEDDESDEIRDNCNTRLNTDSTPLKESRTSQIAISTTPASKFQRDNQFSFPNAYIPSMEEKCGSQIHQTIRATLQKELDEEMEWCNSLLGEVSAELDNDEQN